MNDDIDPIASSIRRRTAQITAVAPDFADVLGHRHQRLRRRAGVASIGLLAIGVGGLFTLSSRSGPITDDLADGPANSAPPSVTIDAATDVPQDALWYCEGRVEYGPDASVEGTLVPTMPMPTSTAPAGFVPDDTVPAVTLPAPAVELESGFFRFCVTVDEFVGAVTTTVDAVPSDTFFPQPTSTLSPDDGLVQPTDPVDVPVSDPAGEPVRGSQTYTVQTGDFPIGVADVFCVDLEVLLAFNDMTVENWPFPGGVLQIPPGHCGDITTVTSTQG